MKKFRTSSRTPMFTCILLSVSAVLLSLWLGGQSISAGESVVIGLIGICISFQVDILVRLNWREQFVSLLDGPAWVAQKMSKIALALDTVNEQYPGMLVEAEAEQRLSNFAVELDELALGRVRTPADDSRFLLVETDTCQRELLAVTNLRRGVDPTVWWRSELGRKYWQANLDALARGVHVVRIFIVDEDAASAVFQDLVVAAHAAAGVQVLTIERSKAPQKYQRNIIIWDDSVSWEADMNADGLAIENVYSLSRNDLNRLRSAFDVLRVIASNHVQPDLPSVADVPSAVEAPVDPEPADLAPAIEPPAVEEPADLAPAV